MKVLILIIEKINYLTLRLIKVKDNIFNIGSKGFALTTVLGISLILMIIATSILFQLKNLISNSEDFENLSKARINVESAYTEVAFYLSGGKKKTYYMEIVNPDGSIKKWNLYGNDIKLNDRVKVQIYDIAGMIPLYYDTGILRNICREFFEDGRGDFFVDSLMDWQDSDSLKRLNGAEKWDYKASNKKYEPRNGKIQLIEEAKLVLNYDKVFSSFMMNNFILSGSGYLNPLTFSNGILKKIIKDDSRFEDIVTARDNFSLTQLDIDDIKKNLSSGFLSLSPSNSFFIRIESNVGKSRCFMETLIMLSTKGKLIKVIARKIF